LHKPSAVPCDPPAPASDVREQLEISTSAAGEPACLNCGAPLGGAYCQACGQRALAERLTLGDVSAEFIQQFLAIDRGLWYTVTELTRDPGGVIRRYLGGQRRRYMGPVTYLLFGTALLLLAYSLFADSDLEYIRSRTESLSKGANPLMTAQQADTFGRIMAAFSQQMTFVTLVIAMPFAVTLRWLFRRTGINLAESVIFTLYVFGHCTVLYIAVVPLLLLFGANSEIRMWTALAAYLLVCVQAGIGFFGGGPGTAVRMGAVLAVSYASSTLVLSFGALLYVLLFVG
jgi:hypothetical protein